MSSASRQPHAPTRDRIIAAAVRLFQANGYHGTGLASILEAAEVPKGSFYHHFPGGKEAVALAALEWLADEINRFLDRMEVEARGLTEVLDGLAHYSAAGLRQPETMRGSLVAVLAQEAVPGSEQIRRALQQAVCAWTARLARFLDETHSPAQAELLARTALALLEGATILARIDGDPAVVGHLLAHGIGERRDAATSSNSTDGPVRRR